ncbi:MAG: hypothetical protein OEV78_06625 [Spirochaetia bacterium]|nr:hypothetical protein [Spirochaetia bacterium]
MKAIIIDDNHSFIDLLKNALQPFRIQIDSCYKFSEARNVLLKGGSYFNHSIANEVLKYHESVLKNNDQNSIPVPVLNAPLINPEGYALVFLEYDAEPSMKGTYFIQDILKNQKEWSERNFILMSSDPSRVEQTAKKMKIALIEKPLKKDFTLKLVKEFLQSMAQKEKEVQDIIEKYGITIRLPDQKPAPTKKKTASSTKKKTAKTDNLKTGSKKKSNLK